MKEKLRHSSECVGLFKLFSPNRSNSCDVCPLLVVPFPCNSPRGAKEIPGEKSCLPPWHHYPEKCTSRNVHHYDWQSPPSPDMQFVTNFTQIKIQNIFLPKKRVSYDKLQFPTKQRKLYFHIINNHTQGYITHNKYIIGIASIGLPKVNLPATKCVTKRP